MKFSKLLVTNGPRSVGPEMNEMFLKYKELKKIIKSIPKADEGNGAKCQLLSSSTGTSVQAQPSSAAPYEEAAQSGTQTTTMGVEDTTTQPTAPAVMHLPLSADEANFIGTLNTQVRQFNEFFEDAEEDAVIRLQALSDELHAWFAAHTKPGSSVAVSCEAHTKLHQLQARIVQLHGQCVLHMHWSLLNYGAIAKILKKHDKRTGIMLRAPYLANVLSQPFNSTSIMSRLVKDAEELLHKARQVVPHQPEPPLSASKTPVAVGATAVKPDTSTKVKDASLEAPVQPQKEDVCKQGGSAAKETTTLNSVAGLARSMIGQLSKQCKVALETWESLRKNASTPSTILDPAVASVNFMRGSTSTLTTTTTTTSDPSRPASPCMLAATCAQKRHMDDGMMEMVPPKKACKGAH